MDAVRMQLQKPLVVGIIGFLAGLILGWFVIGWGIWPVRWTDAAPQHLRDDLKSEYLRMVVDSYTLNKDAALAQARFKELGDGADKLLQELEAAQPGNGTVTAFRAVVTGGAVLPAVTGQPDAGTPGAVVIPSVTEELAPGGGEAETPSTFSVIRSVLIVLCVAVVLVLVGLAAIFFLRSRRKLGPRPTTQSTAAPAYQEDWQDYRPAVTGEEPPMVQFMASYKTGDDLFDDSFSIDSPAGEFLGECGVGISETIGVGDPKKVTAFEVWLFDKNDIQTITKVVMSEHAFTDEVVRQRLAAKGEPVMADPGAETVLETQTLQLVVRVVDMGYGDGALPPHSFFDRIILELAVWPKA